MVHKGTKILVSNRLTLRPVHKDDAEEIYNGFINQKDYLYYTNRQKRTLEEELLSLTGIEEKNKTLNFYNWLIVLNNNNAIIGTINLDVSEINEMVEVNFVIDDCYKNNGYMTEALNLVKNYCFDELKINRFQGGCVIENASSKRVMEKCGMKFEGILRNYIILNDGYHDMNMYSIIRHDIIH